MKIKRPVLFIGVFAISILLTNFVNVVVKTTRFSESYPSVLCPPTLLGTTSQVSVMSKKTMFQSVESKSTKKKPLGVTRYLIKKDSLLIEANGVTPTIWQSRANSWAGAAICSGPTSEQWFVGGTADVTSRGKLVVINSGLGSAIVDIGSWSARGKGPVKTITIRAKSSIITALDMFAPGEGAIALHVVPRSGRINAFMLDVQGKGLKNLGGDFVNSTNALGKEIYISAIPHQKNNTNNPTAHKLRIVNPNGVDATITAELISSDGSFIPVGLNARKIKAGSVSEITLKPKISANVFALRITSDEPITGSVFTMVRVQGRNGLVWDFVWNTPSPELTKFRLAVTGLSPLLVFTSPNINIGMEVLFANGKTMRKTLKGFDIASWRVPDNAKVISFIGVSNATYGAALITSSDGYGAIPLVAGSSLSNAAIPNSNIGTLTPW